MSTKLTKPLPGHSVDLGAALGGLAVIARVERGPITPASGAPYWVVKLEQPCRVEYAKVDAFLDRAATWMVRMEESVYETPDYSYTKEQVPSVVPRGVSEAERKRVYEETTGWAWDRPARGEFGFTDQKFWGQRFKITPFFRWYDIWVGAYIDRDAGAVYICPLPTLGVKIQWRRNPT